METMAQDKDVWFTDDPRHIYTEFAIRVPSKGISALRWNDQSNLIAVFSTRSVEVLDLEDSSHRTRIDNGSGGLGKFAAVEFVGREQLMTVWEFGKAKLWDLATGKSGDLADVKTTCTGQRWQARPRRDATTATTPLALLSRSGAEDVLSLVLPGVCKTVASVKLPTVDAQSLRFSPDGRWISVRDTPTAAHDLYIFTPDGQLFRTYPPVEEAATFSLGTRIAVWSGDSRMVALARYDGKIVLLNTRTFAPLAIIEHNTTVDQTSLRAGAQAQIWQEAVSASGARTYNSMPQPFSPPISRIRPTSEPSELGIAEACFSQDGAFLASRDERMLNTVWIWNTVSLAAHAVIVQHNNIRRMQWQPKSSAVLLLDTGEGVAFVYSPSSAQPPSPISTTLPGAPSLHWLPMPSQEPSILAVARSSFVILGSFDDVSTQPAHGNGDHNTGDEGDSEDSIFDLLSGKQALPPKTEQSYTERVDLEVETEEEGQSTLGMDDTFRDKKNVYEKTEDQERDPLDDSEFF